MKLILTTKARRTLALWTDWNSKKCLRKSKAGGELLATTNSFTATSVGPTADGSWTAAMTCNLVFPGKSVSTGNTAHVYTRFGVPITSYRDYLGGTGAVEADPKGRWVIAVIGYSVMDSINYALEFEYTRWLGAEHPEGDCRLYSSLQEAVEAKDSEDTDTYFGFPETTAADPLISNASISIANVNAVPGRYSLQARCDFSFPGLKYGRNEAYVIINYGMDTDVGSYSDDQSDTVLVEGLTGEFTVAQMYYASSFVSSIVFNVETTDTPVPQMQSGRCLLYAREADARSMVETLYQVSQVSLTPGYVGSTSVPPGAATTTGIPESITSAGNIVNGPQMWENQEARGRDVSGVELWRKRESTCLHGARLCIADPACVAVRCEIDGGDSKGYSSVTGIGSSRKKTKALFVF